MSSRTLATARPGLWMVRARRFAQGIFLLLFLSLFWSARDTGQAASGWLHVFFDLDPLVLLATWLSTQTLAGLSLLAVVTILVTVALGRVFCGWFCPLGTIHQMVTAVRPRLRRVRVGSEGFSPWQRGKYLILVGLLLMALVGAHWIGVLDPLAFLYRSLTTTVLPAGQLAVEEGATTIYRTDPHLGPLHLTALSEPVYRFLRDHLFLTARQAFSGGGLLWLLLLLALGLNIVRPRFWCRYLCPLGGLLGLCAGRTLLRLRQDADACDGCGLCRVSCPAAAQPDQPGRWLAQECFGCWNCVKACRQGALGFAFTPPWRRPQATGVDLRKRAVLGAAAGGLGAFVLLRLPPQAQGRLFRPDLIRPPGSRPEREFLQRCLQCDMCLKSCPTNVLQPAWTEAGLEGLWTPVLKPCFGWCEYECNLCGQVCPTGAIAPLPLTEKKQVHVGLAVIDTTRCLPYAYARECIVCEEHCPIPDKAILFVQTQVRLPDGGVRTLKQPRVDPDLCTGCGICENKCVFKDRPAIRITSAGETRHPGNQPILPGAVGGYGYG